MKIFTAAILLFVITTAKSSFQSSPRARRPRDSEDFTCPETNGNYADPKSCRRFYQCVDGHAYVSRCPSSLFFDDVAKFCTFKNEAKCGPIAATPAPIIEEADLASKCDTNTCTLPNCFCSSDGTQVPGGLDPKEIPQMVIISMDDSVNQNNYDSYRKVFDGRKNPNNCPIHGTFFIAHEYTNYQMVQQLHYDGHEIGTYSLSHRKNFETLNYEEWVEEEIGMREILKNFASISKDDILGMRSPGLKPGRNTQFEVLVDYGYVWDSSASVPPTKMPIWPYTLDHAIVHECRSPCPTRSFPGVWEFPLNSHYTEGFEGGYCPYMDQCVFQNLDENDVLEWLKEDFDRHYLQNRAPYLMAFHTSWFQQKALVKGLDLFMDWLIEKPDVWFVTHTQALYWITEPKTIKEMTNFAAWDCSERVLPPKPCNLANSCALPFKTTNVTDTRYLATCSQCPKVYPWIGDAKGLGLAEKDVYKSDNPSL